MYEHAMLAIASFVSGNDSSLVDYNFYWALVNSPVFRMAL